MKALWVFYRIFHYLKVWCLIFAIGTLGAGLLLGSAASVSGELTAQEVGALVYLFGLISLILVGLAVAFFALAHIFRMIHVIVGRKHAREAELCECCCECEEAPASDLDAQVEEVMKWKNLYVEGIITEREFIDKRNEILRISK